MDIDKSAIEKKWITIEELLKQKSTDISWLWEGYIALGMTTLISAHPKVGKSTLLFHLLPALLNGQDNFLGFQTRLNGKVILLTEEPAGVLMKRLK